MFDTEKHLRQYRAHARLNRITAYVALGLVWGSSLLFVVFA